MFLLAVESSHLGRLDYASLSTQALMEIFIEGIENREIICGNAEEPADVDQWKGFEYVEEQTADAGEKLINIDWYYLDLVGTIDLRWLPPNIYSIIIDDSQLSGSRNLAALPPSIQRLEFTTNAFSGEIDLCHLPAKITIVFLSVNQLSGSINLEKLPTSMQELHLSKNRFTGTVCLRHLPPNFVGLSVRGNELSGTLDLTRLPVMMKYLSIEENNFEGKTDFSQLPEGLKQLNVSHTNLSGEIPVRYRSTYYRIAHSKVQWGQ